MSSKFDPDSYRRYRPFYPTETFANLRERLIARDFTEPFTIADIGCGTGHSALSLLRSGVRGRLIGIDLDPAMLAEAREFVAASPLEISPEFRQGRGESTGLADASVDAILVGSAFHWMNREQTRDEFVRILRPKGVVSIFEYQFPKAPALPELNEWIRRQFNLHWKAPAQKPRGNLEELTQVLNNGFELISETKPSMILELGPDELTGLLLSQSRVLHFEASLQAAEKLKFAAEILTTIRQFMSEKRLQFDFKLGVRLFGRSSDSRQLILDSAER